MRGSGAGIASQEEVRRGCVVVPQVVQGDLQRASPPGQTNVRRRQVDDSPTREILRFEHNVIIRQQAPLGPRRTERRAGIGVSNLGALPDRLDTSGQPLVSMDVVAVDGGVAALWTGCRTRPLTSGTGGAGTDFSHTPI